MGSVTMPISAATSNLISGGISAIYYIGFQIQMVFINSGIQNRYYHTRPS
jgi:hypothetical protein